MRTRSGILPLLLAALAVAQETEDIAIFDLQATGVSEAEGMTLSDKLRSEFVETNKFRVIERGQMDQILKEQGFQQTGCTSQECLVEVGQLIGVKRIVAGSVGRVGNLFVVSIRLVDVTTGEVLRAADEEVKGQIELLLSQGMRNVARRLAGLPVESVPAQPAPEPAAKPEAKKKEKRGGDGLHRARLGAGLHYSFDFSVTMPATPPEGEKVTLKDLRMNTASPYGGDIPFLFDGGDIPIYFDRGELTRTPFSFGAKAFTEGIPGIDGVEFGFDITTWEYDGSVRYPDSIAPTYPVTRPADYLRMMREKNVYVRYDTMSLTLEDNGMNYPGISQTPYVKLCFDLTVRKMIPAGRAQKVIRPYGGLGFNVHFATPIPNDELMQKAWEEVLSGDLTVEDINLILSDPEQSEKLLDLILEELLTPHFGMNILLGTTFKPFRLPFAIYVDARFMIPFAPYDEGAGVEGLGVKLNTGIALQFDKKKR